MSKRLNSEQAWLPLAKQAGWSVKQLAKICGVSTRTLERHFKESVGKPPKAWMTEQRQKKAMKLLREGSFVKETASQLGYKQANSFAREFKKLSGQCPSTLATIPLVKPLQSENVA